MARKKSPVALEIQRTGNVTSVQVLLDGEQVDAEVQWYRGTPYRAAPGGIANETYEDPAKHALSAVRFNPPKSYQITARVLVGEEFVYSDTTELDIN